jgi:GMP synthase-like glutamine amidotransferase
MTNFAPHIMVIDPGVKSPEIDTFNNISLMSPVPCTYHLPAMFGFDSFPDDYKATRALIVLGSMASVHERLPWQIELERRVQIAIDQSIPVLGCCYGHQMLAYMHGGTVAYINDDHIKLQGVRRVEILDNRVWDSGFRNLVVTHNEAVTGLPDELSVLARSDEIAIDGFMHKNRPVFGFQAHPEATKVFVKTREMLDESVFHVLSDGDNIIRQFVHMALGKSS